MKNKRNRKLISGVVFVAIILILLLFFLILYLGRKRTEEKDVLQIQSLEETRLDKRPKLPYEIKLYEKSTEAYNNPVTIYVREDHDEERYISFSFTSERFSVSAVKGGVIIESNKSIYGTDNINYAGDIQTFSVEIPNDIKEISTIIYPICFYNMDYDQKKDDEDEKHMRGYIAFRITPETIGS